jgi:hypothetical protein
VIDDEADEAKDEGGDGTDDDTDGARPEPTAQMLNLQLPPQTWLASPPHLAEQSVSGTLALLTAAFNSFEQ